jgi:hypothetical protein
MLWPPAWRLEFLLINEGPHPSHCGEGAEGLAEVVSSVTAPAAPGVQGNRRMMSQAVVGIKLGRT